VLPSSLDPLSDESLVGYLLRLAHRLETSPARILELANDRLDSAERAKAVASAVRALPAAEREMLLLIAWEQLTPAEAAQALGVPQGTARSRLHRGRAALRLALSEHDAHQTGVST
jgi:RNA polymerase sigma factor (sigma-70 family)